MDSWFKKKIGIVSRKINKFITQAQISNKEELIQEASAFVDQVKLEIFRVGSGNVYNSDQSGFNLESHAGRTLAIISTPKIEWGEARWAHSTFTFSDWIKILFLLHLYKTSGNDEC